MKYRAAIATLAAYDVSWVDYAQHMLDDVTGSAILALLCNARAKQDPLMYAYKNHLLLNAADKAIIAGKDVWCKPHAGYGEFPVDTVIFIETDVGRMQFHVMSTNDIISELVANLPYREEGWNGVAMQPLARNLVISWLENNGFAI